MQIGHRQQITLYNISAKEIFIFSVIIVTLGIGVLGYEWYRYGGLLSASSINVVETVNSTALKETSVSNIAVQDVSPARATISWQLSIPSPVRIEYGISQNQLVVHLDVPSGKTQEDVSGLAPNRRYFFHIITSPGSSSFAVSSTYSFVTPVR